MESSYSVLVIMSQKETRRCQNEDFKAEKIWLLSGVPAHNSTKEISSFYKIFLANASIVRQSTFLLSLRWLKYLQKDQVSVVRRCAGTLKGDQIVSTFDLLFEVFALVEAQPGNIMR